jgi:hypothetical protein
MMKQFFLIAIAVISSLFMLATYSYSRTGSFDNSQYYAQNDSPKCCCKILDMEMSMAYNQDVFDYQYMTKDQCAGEEGQCVDDASKCKQ